MRIAGRQGHPDQASPAPRPWRGQLRHHHIFDRDDPAAFGCIRSFSHGATDRPSSSGDAACSSAADKIRTRGLQPCVRAGAPDVETFAACISSSRASFRVPDGEDFAARMVSSLNP